MKDICDPMKEFVRWIAIVLLSVGALLVGIPKLFATPGVVSALGALGYPRGFVVLLGLFWVLGAVGLWMERTRAFAALGMLFILTGAIATQIVSGAGLGLKVLIFILLCVIVLFTERFFMRVVRPCHAQ